VVFSKERVERLSWLVDDNKRAIKNQIEEIEMLGEEDFHKLVITMKGIRRSLLQKVIINLFDS